jgi:3-mercaptopyruvate sulfurtransferase SseA
MIDFSAHPLVETAWLAAHLSDADVRIVDARWRGDGTSRELYQHGHLPGAIHLDWYHDLSWTDARGAAPFPGKVHAATLSSFARDGHRDLASTARDRFPGSSGRYASS